MAMYPVAGVQEYPSIWGHGHPSEKWQVMVLHPLGMREFHPAFGERRKAKRSAGK